jgi:hypothetical protein
MKHLVLALVASFAASSASACSSLSQPTSEELFAKANSVFRARITEAKLAKFANPLRPGEQVDVVEAKFEVKEVFKGTPPGLVRDFPFGPGNCSLGLLPGVEYVFFPGENGFVLILSGSFAFVNAEGNDVRPHLEALRRQGSSAPR